ncbi:MAG: ABC transporter permease [Deltaproteobacteria bacterium]|nr:ABC transporter permease [Deltaproteobacteria bacterium]
MWDLLRVAIRNVGRNKRRTLITMVTVFLGVVVVTGARGLLSGLQLEFKSALAQKIHGDLQIHRRGYQDSLESNPYKILIPYNDELVERFTKRPDIAAVAPRLRIFGLLNHQKSQSTAPVMITGYDPETELIVCPRFASALQEGRLIDSTQEEETVNVQDTTVEEATSLSDEASLENLKPIKYMPKARGRHQILVTPSLMRGLKAELGDEVVVLLQDKQDMQQAIIGELVGVVDYGMPNVQARMAWMDFRTLQGAAGVRGESSELAILAEKDQNLDTIKAQLGQSLGGDFEVETYLDIGGFFRDIMGLQNAIFSTVVFIVFLIVISAIINTSLMTVMERTREIGTLMALGYRRIHIIFLFVSESIVIGALGGAMGLCVVLALLFYLGNTGIQFQFPGQKVDVVLYPLVSALFVAEVLFLAMFSAVAASFFPAYRASRMRPVKALSTV